MDVAVPSLVEKKTSTGLSSIPDITVMVSDVEPSVSLTV